MVPTPLHRRLPRLLASLLLTALPAVPALAQSPTAARPDPLDPKAQVPPLRYDSSFTQVRRDRQDKPLAWREANDAVARIGGWRAYAREAQQPDSAAASKPAAPAQAPASAPTPRAPTGQSGHKH